MCYNIIDGRLHTECGHFYAMATQQQDCLNTTCRFSTRHPYDCKKASCAQLMQPPIQNHIRISPTSCSECKERQRVGVLGLGHLPIRQLVIAENRGPIVTK